MVIETQACNLIQSIKTAIADAIKPLASRVADSMSINRDQKRMLSLSKTSRHTRRILNALIIGLFVICLTGCSSGLIYRNLSWITPWYIDNLVELDKQQRQELKTLVNSTLTWHKVDELPRYVAFLQDYIDQSDQTIDLQAVQKAQKFLELTLDNLQSQVLDGALPIFFSLNDKQKEQFWRNMQKRQTDYDEKYLGRSDKEYQLQLEARYLSNLENCLGSLTDQQEAIIASTLKNLQRNDQGWLQTRVKWLATIEQQHRQANHLLPLENSHTLTKNTLLNRSYYESAETHRINEINIIYARQMVVDILSVRTQQQSEHLKDYLISWQKKFQRWQK